MLQMSLFDKMYEPFGYSSRVMFTKCLKNLGFYRYQYFEVSPDDQKILLGRGLTELSINKADLEVASFEEQSPSQIYKISDKQTYFSYCSVSKTNRFALFDFSDM